MKTNETPARLAGGSLARQLSFFYFPLAIQGFSMSLTYPLVGSVVAHGRLGATEYAIMAQAQAIMFLVGSIGSGMISTGMIFASSKKGLRNYTSLSIALGLGAIALQALCCVHPFDNLVFGRFYHLEGELFELARRMLLLSIPMNFSFFVRNAGISTLFREKRTDKATFATFFRIGLTWAASVILVRMGLVGWKWGLGLTTLAVWVETILLLAFALPYARKLPESGEENASIGKQCAFTIPLSLGGMMLCISGTMIPVFLALTPDHEISRNIHYIAFGILNPLSFAAARMQSVTIAFPPREHRRGAIFTFAVAIGVLMSVLSGLLQVPAISRWYFGSVQNLAPEVVPLAARAMLVIGVIPLVLSIKGFSEGQAAIIRRPNAILSGQIAYLAAQVLVFFLLVHFAPVAGYLMSGISILSAQLCSLLIIRIALYANRIADDYGVAHATRPSR